MMTHKLLITCPRCQRRNVRIRVENLGRKVRCKFCSQTFRARPDDDVDGPNAAEAGDAGTHLLGASLAERLREILAGNGAWGEGSAMAPRMLEESNARVQRLERQVRTLEEQLE